MHIVIPICIQMSLYTYRDGPFSNPYMHMGIKINPCMHTRIAHIPVCIRGLCVMGSLYAYGDSANPCMHTGINSCNPHMHTRILIKSPYAHGELRDPHMHTRIDLNPCMHTGIMCHAIPIPVCTRGSIKSPYTYGDQDQSPYAYGD